MATAPGWPATLGEKRTNDVITFCRLGGNLLSLLKKKKKKKNERRRCRSRARGERAPVVGTIQLPEAPTSIVPKLQLSLLSYLRRWWEGKFHL